MAPNQNRIEVTLSLRDLASRGLRQFADEVRRTGHVVERETRETGDDFDKLEDEVRRETRKAERSVDRFADSARRDLRRVEKATKSTGTAFGAFAKRTLVGLAGIEAARRTVGVGFGFVEDAAAAEETLNRFGVVFGEQAAAAEAQVQRLSTTLGRSTGALRSYANEYQGLLTALDLSREEAADLSIELTKLQLDLASFQDLSDSDVQTRLFSGLVGEAEAVRRFGVDLSQAAIEAEALRRGIEGGTDSLTQQQKVLIRAALLFKNTADAQGDLIRTQDSFQNQLKRLQGRLDEVRVILGQQIVAAIQDTIDELGGVDAVAERIAQGFRVAAGFTLVSIELTRQGVDAIDRYVESAGGIEQVFDGAAEGVGFLVERSQEGIARVGLLATLTFNTITGAVDVASAAVSSISDDIDAAGRALDRIGSRLGVVGEAGGTAAKGLKNLLREDKGDLARRPPGSPDRAASQESVGAIIRRTAAANEEAVRVFKQLSAEAEESGASAAASFRSLNPLVAGYFDTLKKAAGKLPDLNAQLEESGTRTSETLANAESLFRGVAASQSSASASAFDYGRAIEFVRDATLSVSDATRKAYETRLQEIELGAEALRQAQRYRVELERQADAGAGADAAIERYGQSLSNFALAGDLVTGVFGALENGAQSFARSLVDSSRSSSDALKGLAQDVAALAIQFALLRSIRGALGFGPAGLATGGGLGGALSGAFGGGGQQFASGGIGPGPMVGHTPLPVNAYASGGVANSPQLAVFGEGRTAEAFVPLPDGKRIPVAMQGGGGDARPQVTINMQSMDPSKAADVILNAMPQIEGALTSRLMTGANRKLGTAVRTTALRNA